MAGLRLINFPICTIATHKILSGYRVSWHGNIAGGRQRLLEKCQPILPPGHLVNRPIHDNVRKYRLPRQACKIWLKIFLTFFATICLPFCFTASSGGENTSVNVS